MTEQSEALRLADALEHDPLKWCDEAAAELRRLHAENERLHQINQSHEMRLSVRGYEIQIADLEAQRDALLEAMTFIANTNPVDAALDPQRAVRVANAAIKAVEEGK